MGGLRTAESLRRFGFQDEITIIGAESHLPYNRPPLSKDLLVHNKDFATVAFPFNEDELKASFVLGDPAISLDIFHKKVSLVSGKEFNYDYLVAATGLRSRVITFPNNLKSGRFSLRTYDDAKALRAAVSPGKRVVILGAGFIGLELAATLTKLGSSVDIVAIEEIPLAAILGDDFGREVQRRHENEGVKFHLGISVSDLVGTSGVEAVHLSDGTTIDCEIFVEAVGSQPNIEWLQGNSLELSNGVMTDQTLRATRNDGSSIDDFFVVGDIARFPYYSRSLPPRRIEHWNIPIETAKHVGREITLHSNPGSLGNAQGPAPFNPLPSFWSDQFGISILSYGEPKIADKIELSDGSIEGEFVFTYLREGELVGVAGIGKRKEVNRYRTGIRL